MQKKWRLILLLVGCFLGGIGVVQAHAAVPDISEWQGQLTSTEVQSLKSQADFVINRVQYGSSYEDLYHTSNESLYVKYVFRSGPMTMRPLRVPRLPKPRQISSINAQIRTRSSTSWILKRLP